MKSLLRAFARSLLVVPFAVGAASSSLATTYVPNARYDAETVKRFAKELAPFVKQLTREVTMWHHAPRTKIGAAVQAGPRDEAIMTYAKSKPDFFWKIEAEVRNMAGNGLYFGRDPIQTVAFGGVEDPGVLEVSFRRGLRVLDAEGYANLTVSPELGTMLAKHGCTSVSFSLMTYAADPRGNACQEIFKLALKALDVGLIGYSYNPTSTLTGCAPAGTTFVVIDDEAIEPSRLTYLGKDLSKATPEQRLKAWRIAKLAPDSPNRAEGVVVTNWLKPAVDAVTPTPADEKAFADWKKSNIVGCDGTPSSIYEPIPANAIDSDKEAIALINDMLKEVTNFEKVGLLAACPKQQWIKVQSATVEPKSSTNIGTGASWKSASSSAKDKLVAYCDGVDTCAYDVQFMTSASSIDAAALVTVTWTCVGGDEKKPKTVTADFAFDARLLLTCP